MVMQSLPQTNPTVFILDVDGVMTTGQFYYSAEGKVMKVFGPDDHDALMLLKPHLDIQFISGDLRGFEISRKRIVEDMGFPLTHVSGSKRIEWIVQHYNPQRVIYMGDGIFDPLVMRQVAYSIAPANADRNALLCADYVTERSGGDRAVAEACLHLLSHFFQLDFSPLQVTR